VTDRYHHENIYRTLLLGGALTGKTKRELYEPLDRYDDEFLGEMNYFFFELYGKRLSKILMKFSTSLFRLSPDEYKTAVRPYMDHYLDLCKIINGSSQWASICSSLINGLKNYEAYRSGSLSRETVGNLLQAAAVIITASYDMSHNSEELYQHVEHYGSLPEGELVDFLIATPDAVSYLRTLLHRGDFRVAELVAVTNGETSLVLTDGAL
jgi:hypothetical protein